MTYIPPERLLRSLVDSGCAIEKISRMTGASERTLYRIMAGENDIRLGLYFTIYALWETVAKGEGDGV